MKTLRVVAAVIHAEGKIFATQRGYGEYKDGWEFPGARLRLARLQRMLIMAGLYHEGE